MVELEKPNSVSYDDISNTAIKTLGTPTQANSERIILQTLATDNVEKTSAFKVPQFIDTPDPLSVRMSFITGVRVFDFMSVLNKIIKSDQQSHLIRDKAYSLKHSMIQWALDALLFFQDSKTQHAFSQNLTGFITPYPYSEKFTEALEYLSKRFRFELDTRLLEEVLYICSVFQDQPGKTHFRDASLKNRFISLDGLLKRSNYDPMYVTTRPSDYQWENIGIVIALLELTELSEFKTRIIDIDFESAYALTTPQDDYLHILAFEASSLPYESAEPYWSQVLNIKEELYNYAILFRCFREWVRRLFYKQELSEKFSVRYYHEALHYNLNTAISALERIRVNSFQKYNFENLYRLMLDFRAIS